MSVPFPRPRRTEIRALPEFRDLLVELWSYLTERILEKPIMLDVLEVKSAEQPVVSELAPTRRRRLPRFNVEYIGIVIMLCAWELYATHVHDQNPRRSDTMFPRFEYIATNSYPEFATFYGTDQGMIGQRSDRQATIVLIENSLATARRVVIGVGVGISLGIAVGLLVGWSRWVREIVLPPILLLRTIPILALIPLFLFWFGTREIGILIYITFAVFAMMIINTIEAIRNVSPLFQDYARCMGASQSQVYRTIIMPAIVPSWRAVFESFWASRGQSRSRVSCWRRTGGLDGS